MSETTPLKPEKEKNWEKKEEMIVQTTAPEAKKQKAAPSREGWLSKQADSTVTVVV